MIALHNRCGLLVALLAVAGATSACSQSATTLPDPATMPARSGAAADRVRHRQSMDDLEARGGAHASEAVKQIESAR